MNPTGPFRAVRDSPGSPDRHARSWWQAPVLAIALTVAITIALRAAVPLVWVHEPVHAMIETVGGVLALLIAGLLVWGRDLYSDGPLAKIVGALVVMGILDLCHAGLHPGPAFFWSRGLPTVIAGALFATVWFRALGTHRLAWVLALSVGVGALLSVALIAFPDRWPVAFASDGTYTTWAKLVNVAGGVGFCVGAAYFVQRHARHGELVDEIFGAHCLLFGCAGVLFWISSVWSGAWWAFHLLRLLAYLALFGAVVDMRRRLERRLAHQVETELAASLDELAARSATPVPGHEP
jgi:hypothetical protein